jgi:hypothetical protein
MNVLLRRRFQKQNAGTVSGTNNRTRWFFNYLMSCISNRLHDQSILLANSNISQSINVSGEPDIMKLTDIVQHSEPIGEGNASMGSSPNRSLAPSTHKVDT